MCLGIPGQVIELLDREGGLAKVDISGVRRDVSHARLRAGTSTGIYGHARLLPTPVSSPLGRGSDSSSGKLNGTLLRMKRFIFVIVSS